MTGLGERLKQARAEKGYTLDDLQAITKIQKRYLSSIENEDFGTMPGAFYVRAFIKQYAEAVGLDADEMLSLYRKSSGVNEIEEEQALPTTTLSRSSKRSPRSNKQLNEAMPKVIFALFVIVIIGVIYFLWIHGESNKQQLDVGTENPITVQDKQDAGEQNPDKKPVVEEAPEKEEKEEIPEEPEVVEQTLTQVGTEGENSMYSLVNSKDVKLEIRTSGESWISVLDSSRVERTEGARIMKAGESIELDVTDTESIRIRVGRTTSTDIFINGEQLEYSSDRVTQNIIIEYEKEE